MKASKTGIVLLAGCLILLPASAGAARLGKMTVLSALGEPFSAEIGLSASEEEMATLTARIASSEDYAEQGIEFAPALAAVHVGIGKQADNKPIIRLSAPQPHGSPFLDMLIQVEWAKGRLMREYTTVPNPEAAIPQLAAPQPEPQPAPVPPPVATPQPTPPTPQPAPAMVETTPPPAPERVVESEKTTPAKVDLSTAPPAKLPGSPVAGQSRQPKPKVVEKAPEPPKPVAPPRSTEHAAANYVVKKGDTLNSIATRMKVDGASLDQMLVGLFRANKDAFIDGNMNRLKAGQKLSVPNLAELQSISPQAAREDVRVHTADWHSYRMKVAAMAKESDAPEEKNTQKPSEGKITAVTPPDTSTNASGSRNVVKLSSDKAGDGKAGKGEAVSKLAALQDDAVAREKTLSESKEKNKLLEKQVQDVRKLLDIKNKLLAEKTRPAAPVTAPVTAPVAPPVTPPAPQDFISGHSSKLIAGAVGLLILLFGLWFQSRGRNRDQEHELSDQHLDDLTVMPLINIDHLINEKPRKPDTSA